MDLEDQPRKAKPSITVGDNLDSLSIVELGRRLFLLEAEIERVRTEMRKKEASRAAADGLFGKT